jgi:hypothetical protein
MYLESRQERTEGAGMSQARLLEIQAWGSAVRSRGSVDWVIFDLEWTAFERFRDLALQSRCQKHHPALSRGSWSARPKAMVGHLAAVARSPASPFCGSRVFGVLK